MTEIIPLVAIHYNELIIFFRKHAPNNYSNTVNNLLSIKKILIECFSHRKIL